MLIDIELSSEELAALAWLTREPSWDIKRNVERIEMNLWRHGRRFDTQTPADKPIVKELATLALQGRRLVDHFEAELRERELAKQHEAMNGRPPTH